MMFHLGVIVSDPFNPAEVRHLFHGTGVELKGPVRPGGSDGVFWTAEASAVAQCYIPATGSSAYITIGSFDLDKKVTPQAGNVIDLARQVGPVPFDIKTDDRGFVRSWRVPENCVTYRELLNYVQDILGYKSTGGGGDFRFEILTEYRGSTAVPTFLPADYKRPGSLLVVDGFQGMRFLDLSIGESDLTNPQHTKLDAFRKAEADGYDGVIIDDFAQSKTWGNVDHRAVGFFAGALARLNIEIIPCVRFDWGRENLSATDSPEFLTWSRAKTAKVELSRSAVAAARRGPVSRAIAA
jgi:hypothetical protein